MHAGTVWDARDQEPKVIFRERPVLSLPPLTKTRQTWVWCLMPATLILGSRGRRPDKLSPAHAVRFQDVTVTHLSLAAMPDNLSSIPGA